MADPGQLAPTLTRDETAKDRACVLIAHGGGGELMRRLVRDRIAPILAATRRGGEADALCSVAQGALTDGAILPWAAGELVFTTDSYVVTPIEFPGGDIGRLAVCGTVNDLAAMGAEPVALSLGLILEEGLPLATLDRVMHSVATAAREAGVEIVTGDTKVIERRGASPGLMINTAGVGRMRPGVRLGVDRIEPGDCVLVSGPIAEHGLAIMSVRNGLEFDTPLRSDAAPLYGMIARLLDLGGCVKFLRDATRGGVADVLADISESQSFTIEIQESCVPLSPTARQAAELLGLDPLGVANEGVVVCVVDGARCQESLEALRADPLGGHAACIGNISQGRTPLVEFVTRCGGRRIIRRPYGEELPRIC
jgi:hydrogenase expression/formation protein HypE